MAMTRLYALLCLCFGCTCGDAAPANPVPANPVSEAPEDFYFASLVEVREEVPAAFVAALPERTAQWRTWGPEYPPLDLVEESLHFSSEMRQRYVTAVEHALEEGDSLNEVLMVQGDILRWLEGDECEWLIERALELDAEESAQTYFWIAYAKCAPRNAHTESLFARPGAPPAAVVTYSILDRRFSLPLNPRLVASVRQATEEEYETDAKHLTGMAVMVLLGYEGGLDEVLRLREDFPASRDVIDAELRLETDPRARRIFTAYCRRHSDEHGCGRNWTPSPEPPIQALSEEVRSYSFHVADYLDRHPEQGELVRDALVECIAEGEHVAHECLKRLAYVDRPRAREIAAGMSESPGHAGLFRTLRDDEDAESLAGRLRRLHLLSSVERGALTPFDLLRGSHRAARFDVDTVGSDPEYARLLRRLAALSPDDALVGTFFDEEQREDGSLLLHAWQSGDKWTLSGVVAAAPGLQTVVGMLNALSRRKGSDARWLLVEGEGVCVVAGPEAGLLEALEQQLLVRR